jgi:hypothetical protein
MQCYIYILKYVLNIYIKQQIIFNIFKFMNLKPIDKFGLNSMKILELSYFCYKNKIFTLNLAKLKLKFINLV